LEQKDIYPFSKADKILLYSFKSVYKPFKNYYDKIENRCKIENDTFKIQEVFEVKTIKEKQRKKLFFLCFELKKVKQKFDPNQKIDDGSVFCYNPRHAIVFLKGNKAFAFLEICFQCKITRESARFNFEEFCDERFFLLEKFFRDCGIKKGFLPSDDRFITDPHIIKYFLDKTSNGCKSFILTLFKK
jgi:hypothetical protein